MKNLKSVRLLAVVLTVTLMLTAGVTTTMAAERPGVTVKATGSLLSEGFGVGVVFCGESLSAGDAYSSFEMTMESLEDADEGLNSWTFAEAIYGSISCDGLAQAHITTTTAVTKIDIRAVYLFLTYGDNYSPSSRLMDVRPISPGINAGGYSVTTDFDADGDTETKSMTITLDWGMKDLGGGGGPRYLCDSVLCGGY